MLNDSHLSRHEFLRRSGYGLGGLFLATALAKDCAAGPDAAPSHQAGRMHFPAKAKHIIHIFASGGPSQVDTFDPKPALERFRDKELPGRNGVAFPSPFKFKQHGNSGQSISEVFPQLSTVADELCVVRSMYTDVPAHRPATIFMHTGSLQIPKPSLGSWVLYGLGSANENLPGFVALGGNSEWRQASFLPSQFQGTRADFGRTKRVDKIMLNLTNEFESLEQQRAQLDLAGKLNNLHLEKVQRDEQLEARIDSFELAFRMQSAATDAFDIRKEPAAAHEAYGKSELGAKLLVARRLVERGVRFVQVETGGWDNHKDLSQVLHRSADAIDQPTAALINDLKARGLLDSTLVIWGGEFGRTPTTNGKVEETSGRNHHADAFSIWMAGGGVKKGVTYGATDEFGDKIVANPVHVHDLHPTILRLVGFDHTKLTHRYNGRDFRLTDTKGTIVSDIIA